MNIPFIANIAKEHPAVARLLELSLWAFVAYVVAAILAGDPFSWQAAMTAALAPIMPVLAKRQRDLQKQLKI